MADNGSVLFIVFGKICDNKALSLCRGFSDALGSDAIAFRIAFRIALFFFSKFVVSGNSEPFVSITLSTAPYTCSALLKIIKYVNFNAFFHLSR